MNTVDALDGLIGIAIPLVTGFLTKESWPGWIKAGIMFLLSLIVAGVKVAVSGQLDVNGDHLFTTFFVIAASAQVSYQAITSDFAKRLQAVGPIKDSPPAPQPATLEEKTNF